MTNDVSHPPLDSSRTVHRSFLRRSVATADQWSRRHNSAQERSRDWKVLRPRGDGRLTNIELLDHKGTPVSDSFIEATGIPETDLYRLNLTHAVWRPCPGKPFAATPPIAVSVTDLLTDGRGNTMIDAGRHGQTVRLKGRVSGFSSQSARQQLATLDSNGLSIVVDASTCPEAFRGIEPGCSVSVTGVFVIETKNWKPSESLPRITNVRLVVSRPDAVVRMGISALLSAESDIVSVGTNRSRDNSPQEASAEDLIWQLAKGEVKELTDSFHGGKPHGSRKTMKDAALRARSF